MKLTIPEGPFAGYIFDCDGTLADSMPLHFEAWEETMKEVGGYITEAMHYEWGGMPNAAIVEKLNQMQGLHLDPEDVVRRKHRHYLERVERVTAIEPVVELARKYAKEGKVAVASGGRRVLVERTLGVLGLLDLFPVVVTADDYREGKPNPEPFLLAAKKMGVEPGECLVFDDGDTGVEAARRAGMRWVQVPSAPEEFRDWSREG